MPSQMSKRSELRQKPGPHKALRGSRASGGPWSFHQESELTWPEVPNLLLAQRGAGWRTAADPGGACPASLPPSSTTGRRQAPRRGRAPCEPLRSRRREAPPVLPVGGIPGRMDRCTADGSLLSRPPGAPSHTPSPPQAVTSEAPQDVTYAQLNHSTLRRGTAAPPSPLAGEPPADPSEHVALAVR